MPLMVHSDKTQLMTSNSLGPCMIGETKLDPKQTSDLLGIIFDIIGNFRENNEATAEEMSRRVGAVRRLTAHIPRGKLLREIGSALVVGKASYGCWVTRVARVEDTRNSTQHVGQVQLNDLARILLGHTRKEHIRVTDLSNRANIPTMNELVIKRASLEAWKANNGGVLSRGLEKISTNTRAASASLIRSKTDSIPCKNLEACWNSFPDIRASVSKSAAKSKSKTISRQCRFY